MTDTTPDIVVLRKNTEGLSTETYAETLGERLPNYEIAHARTPTQEQELIRHASVATGVSLADEVLDNAENLQLFVAASSGYNHLPVDELNQRGVVLANASGIHAPGIADQAIGYCCLFARQLHVGLERNQDHEWRHYKASEFNGSTVTIVGMGAIGQTIIERLEGFNTETIGVRNTPEKGGATDEVIGFEDEPFHEALSRTDFLILATPLSETTRGLIGKKELTTLPPEAHLINVSRGAVVETEALLAAIQSESISGAALDVTDPEPLPPEHPLWRMDNVLITPHMGGHTPYHWDRLADILATNVRKLADGHTEGFRNQINEPVDQTTASSTDFKD